MSCANYSSLPQLLRVTAYILRPIKRLRARETCDSNLPVVLTPEEIAVAEKLWIANTQKDLVLQKNFDTLKTQFGLFLDEKGLWRCGGRLQNAGIPFTAKHLLLLRREHPFTTLIVCDTHRRVGHNGKMYMASKFCLQTYAPSLMISSMYSVHSPPLQGALAYTVYKLKL